MEKYDLVLIGATFSSVGIAKGFKGKCLIVETKAKPGYEFIDAFCSGENLEKRCETKEGKAFKNYFKKEELLVKPFAPEWTAFLSNYICENNIDILLFTNVLKIENVASAKKLTIFNSLGKSEIEAKRVIDTRTNSFAYKTLNAVVYGEEFYEYAGGINITYSEDNIRIVEFLIPNGYDYPKARNLVYSVFENRPEKLMGTKIAAVADIFFEKSDVEKVDIDTFHSEIYSTYFDNPFIAFDNGVKIGGSLCD